MNDYTNVLKAYAVFVIATACAWPLILRISIQYGVERNAIFRRFITWFAVASAYLLSGDFWIFLAISTFVATWSASREKNLPALSFVMLMAAPMTTREIPGLGLFNYLIEVDFRRAFCILVIFPFVLRLYNKDKSTASLILPDYFVIGLLALRAFAYFETTTFTNALRLGLAYPLVDTVIPYFMISRALRTSKQVDEAILMLVLGCLPHALIAGFESIRHWHIFQTASSAMGLVSGPSVFLARGDGLRAMSSTGHPINLGFVFAVVTIISFRFVTASSRQISFLLVSAMSIGLIAALSRGPWVGAVAGTCVYLLQGKNRIRNATALFFIAVIAITVLTFTHYGEKFVDSLPLVGAVEDETAAYRVRLFEVGIRLFLEYPLLGSRDFLYYMEELRQGQGIIDLVNTYLAIALSYGGLGLICFLGALVSSAFKTFNIESKGVHQPALFLLHRRALVSALVAVLVTLATTSIWGHVELLTWQIAGLLAAIASRLQSELEVDGSTPIQQ